MKKRVHKSRSERKLQRLKTKQYIYSKVIELKAKLEKDETEWHGIYSPQVMSKEDSQDEVSLSEEENKTIE